jgi:hypothetical protein
MWVHSFTLSYIHASMKCDSHASFLARTFVNTCLDHKPKARVVTQKVSTPLELEIEAIREGNNAE